MRNVLSATDGARSTRSTASARSMPSTREAAQARAARATTSRVIRGGLPSSAGRSMSTGLLPNSGSRTSRCRSSVASPTTAKGQRSRSQISRNRPSESGAMARTYRSCASLHQTSRGVMPGSSFGAARRSMRAAPARPVDDLGQRVRQPAGADVVDREDRVRRPERPAAVDHLLGAALDLGVAALHRVEVEIGRVRPGRHRRRGPAAHADEHRRARRSG